MNKDLYCTKYFYFEQMLLFVTFYSSNYQIKNITCSKKQYNSFNTDNKSAYNYDFRRSRDTDD